MLMALRGGNAIALISDFAFAIIKYIITANFVLKVYCTFNTVRIS